ncbi:hypothetical protein PIB30_035522 [Stylosanthes scabra]|uniref:Leucine-rich repeat-containing N-terminal plant-type domain-containing protein n=1 Tax=Stylosanthes scabra TaxID=79078 RepID=A0ABU6ZCG5_9FABA|nr:hypothetical protein [Stylosanthes scabra]
MTRNECFSYATTALALVLVVLLITEFGSSYGCLQPERQALLNLKAILHYDRRDTALLPSWEGDDDCCEWEGIACDNVTRHIVTLDLHDRYALEDVSGYLSQLQHLTYLDLSRVQLHVVPAFLASMQHLRFLSLQGGFEQLRIPSRSIGNLTNLRALYLDGFTLSDVSASTWLAPLSSLQYLGLYKMDLSMAQPHHLLKVLNTLPSLLHLQLVACGLGDMSSLHHSHPTFHLTNLTRLQLLNLGWNDLNQDSPVLHAFENITSIKVLDISHNSLTSVLPWIAKLHNLVKLDLSWNSITVLDPLRNLTSIQNLQLSYNQNLTSLPQWFAHFDNLQVLSLSHSGFSGEVPSSLENMTSIRSLDLSYNSLSSIAPLWLGKFQNLVELDFSSNLLHGAVPYALRNLTSLTFLDLSRNNFNSLPSWLGELKSLVHVDLSWNNFTTVEEGFLSSILNNLCHLREFRLLLSNGQGFPFKIKGTLSGCNSYALESLNLDWNKFGGLLPSWLGQFQNLKYLILGSNSFSGPIPFSIGNLTKLTDLRLGGNIFNGSIPHSLVQLVNLQHLDLSSNHFSGVIPQRFAHEPLPDIMPNLESLLLHDNRINGSLPSTLGTLYSLDISNNNLSGKIPSTLWNLSSLGWLHLNNNKFQGKLPSSLANMEELTLLDVGENHLSGFIPSWNGSEFPNLQIIRMRRNMFIDRVPSSFCEFVALQILDLAENNLVGPIPRCIGNITGMTSPYTPTLQAESSDWDKQDVKQVIKGRELDYIRNLKYVVNLDLSNNLLSGSIPTGISSLSRLIGLNLSDNHLVGEIPEMMGDMKSLESIDFSHNHLFGAIPRSMSDLTFLSHLNLSYNNLSGPIPDGSQFQVMNDPSSYAGNQYLCGAPLPKLCAGDGPHHVPNIEGNEDEDRENEKVEKVLFYFVIFLGFGTGFWGIIGVLYFKKNWRYVCFGYADKVADRIYVAFVLKKIKVKEMMQRNL